MDENYIIGTLVLCGICFWLGIHYAQVRLMIRLSKDPDKFIDMLNQIKAINDSEEFGMPEDAIEVEAETQNGVVYAYDKATGKFLGQAADLHSVLIEAAKRNPGKNFWHPELKEDRQTT